MEYIVFVTFTKLALVLTLHYYVKVVEYWQERVRIVKALTDPVELMQGVTMILDAHCSR